MDNFYLLINLLIFLLQNCHYIIIVFILCHGFSKSILSIVGTLPCIINIRVTILKKIQNFLITYIQCNNPHNYLELFIMRKTRDEI